MGTDVFSPSLTYYNKGGSFPYGVVALYHNFSQYVYSQVYNGSPTSDWTLNTLSSGDGYFPNVTHETSSSGVPKQIWTDWSPLPHSLVYNSNYLPKQNLTAGREFHRAVVITDSLTGSHLRIEITQPFIKTTAGKEIYIPFMATSSYSDLVNKNPFDFLKTEADNLPSDAESISFSVYINSSKPDTLEGGRINSDKSTSFKSITFENGLKNSVDKSLLSSFGRIALSDVGGNYGYSKTFALDVSNFRNKDVILSPEISFLGTFKKNNLRFGLVNVTFMNDSSINKDQNNFVSKEITPLKYALEQNYPNPFNPSTEIKYSLKEAGHVTLKIFDMLGREIKTLINENQSAGDHKVSFQAQSAGGGLSSGIYFYSLTTDNFHQTRKMILLR